MFKKFSSTDFILMGTALITLIFSEMLYFQGERDDAIFIGLWVPSILAFGIYLKIIKTWKHD
jgi:hypothetical protein